MSIRFRNWERRNITKGNVKSNGMVTEFRNGYEKWVRAYEDYQRWVLRLCDKAKKGDKDAAQKLWEQEKLKVYTPAEIDRFVEGR